MIRVACTALLKRIMAGHPNKDGIALKGGGQDVTSDCLKAIIEFVEPGKIVVVNENGTPAYEIEVRKI
jgi:hypothetical protein